MDVFDTMKERITGIISFLSAVGWGLFFMYLMVDYGFDDSESVYMAIFMFIFVISTCLYVIWTSFGNIRGSELRSIEYENKLLQRRLERKELQKRLEE